MDLSSSVSSLLTIHNGIVVRVVTNSFPKTQHLRTSIHHGLHGGGGCGFHSFFLLRGGGGIQGLQALRGSHGRKLGFELAQNGGVVVKSKVMCSSNSSSSSSEPSSSSSTTSDSKNSASGALAAATSTSSTSMSLGNEDSGFLKRVFEVPRSLWQQLIMQPLMRGFVGFGKRGSVWKGGVGMFVMAGAVLLAITLIWVNGKQIRGATTRKYEVVLEFAIAQGITVGTSVRIRGVEVGNVVEVRPSLQRIDAVVELVDSGIVIPRNALVEVNQSGLVSETLIDITPRLPLPKPSLGPLDLGCSDEGLIVCDRESIKGEQGVSLDELVGICIKLARQVDDMGVANMADMAERLGKAAEEAKPLLSKAQLMAEDIGPLLKEMREGELLKDLAYLMKFATKSGRDLGVLSQSVLTSENRHHLQDSVSTLSKALKQVESISADVSSVTGDARTRHNLRQLIETLSRLVTD
ncbi:unnamed protein product [Sphagnum jensenii]|uniref:Mce/MlaD domain-containing protein n=1 Tax=Sphagnum jensenii TaxID=128206 RepID=A0ABP0X9E3_9BRYO